VTEQKRTKPRFSYPPSGIAIAGLEGVNQSHSVKDVDLNIYIDVVGGGVTSQTGRHWEGFAGFALLCPGIRRIGFHRDEERMYG